MKYIFDQTLDMFLKERNRVTDEQLADISRVHALEGGGWAGHFVDADIITENDLVRLIIEATLVPYLPILNVSFRDELVNEFAIEFLQTFECIPVDRIGPLLTIVTPNPFQPELIRSRTTKINVVELFICRVSEWREVMKRIMDKANDKKKSQIKKKK